MKLKNWEEQQNFLEIDPSLVSGKLIGSDIARMI